MGIASQVFKILLHLFSFKFLMVHGLLYNISSSQFCYSYIIIFSCLLFLHHFNLLTDFNCISFYVLCPFVPVCLSFLTALSLLHSCSFRCLLLALSESSFLHKLFLFLPIVLIKCLQYLFHTIYSYNPLLPGISFLTSLSYNAIVYSPYRLVVVIKQH